jgi:hypothetical protein
MERLFEWLLLNFKQLWLEMKVENFAFGRVGVLAKDVNETNIVGRLSLVKIVLDLLMRT